MRFGFCTGFANAPVLKAVGYDYLEANLRDLAALPEEEFRADLALMKSLDMKAETFNCFYAAQTVVGENPTAEADLREYTHRAFERAALLGGKVAVYGSSKARNIPQGFSAARAREQFCRAARLSGEIGAQYGILVAIEPLNAAETNFIHTVDEGLDIMRAVNHPNVRVLADVYHVCRMNEGFEGIVRAGRDLRHVHIAEPEHRMPPTRADAFDYDAVADALRKAGYDARMSVECFSKVEKPFAEVAAEALATLKQHFTF